MSDLFEEFFEEFPTGGMMMGRGMEFLEGCAGAQFGRDVAFAVFHEAHAHAQRYARPFFAILRALGVFCVKFLSLNGHRVYSSV